MRALVLICLAACGGAFGDTPTSDAPDVDAPGACSTGISYDVLPPFASPTTFVRAAANITNSPGQHDFEWFVLFNNQLRTFQDAELDHSAIRFDATQAGIYTVRYRIEDPLCAEATADVEVNPQDANTTVLRVHVVAPPDLERPPVDKQVPVTSGPVDLIEDVQLATGVTAAGTVLFGGAPIAAYLKFMPTVGSDAVVETYSDMLGNYSAQVRGETHTVLVIPTSTGVSPQVVTWTPGQTTLQLSQGIPVDGTVVDSTGAGILGASVQVTIDGIPSTIATTSSGGTFSLLAPLASGIVRFEVIPPPSLGFPRLVATSTVPFIVGPDMTIQFAAQTPRDLTTATIQRGAATLGGATVTIVGTLPDPAGTITRGAVSLDAVGEVRASAVTAGNGDMPSLKVPAAVLHAVIFPAGNTGDHAVTQIDLTATVPGTINAAPMQIRSTQLTTKPPAATPLPGAILDAVPDGPLALAGAPTIRAVADAGGDVTITLAPGATYDLRLTDPNGNRAALKVVEDRNTTNLGATNPLEKATKVQSTVVGAGPIPGAIVQFLCANCTGIARSRPIAEGVTGVDGKFSLAVPDPN